MQLLHRVAGRLWRLVGPRLQWRLLRMRQATFLVGLTGVVVNHEGRVLVLQHRYWMGNPHGLPSGWAEVGETWEEGFSREVREEVGLAVHDVRVAWARAVPGSRRGRRVEVVLTARAMSTASPRPDGTEVLGAWFLPPPQARSRLRREHADLVARLVSPAPDAVES
jgi:ADP-ribose pyrophosphatase YjhB (NUDIX family)